jgi:hypothetical protein
MLWLHMLHSGGGTPHKPSILGSNGHVLHESTAMATYLIAAGVAPGDILKVRNVQYHCFQYKGGQLLHKSRSSACAGREQILILLRTSYLRTLAVCCNGRAQHCLPTKDAQL